MKLKERKNILLYIFIDFIVSSCTYLLFYKNLWLSIILGSCFFIFLVFFIKKLDLLIILSLFFIVPIISNIFYYNYNFKSNEEIRVISLNSYGGTGEIRGRKVYLSGNLENVKLGDRIIAEISVDKNISIEKGLLAEVKVDNFKILDLDFKGKIYRIREDIFYRLREKLGSRRAALITSISFGYTEFLDREDENTMKNLGVLHAVSVSGLHMVLVYSCLKKIFGEKVAPIVAFIYVLFTGAAVSTIRAYIMLLCSSLAIPFRRSYNALAGLALAGIILILWKPYTIFEVGFQLSFLSTLGIILYNKKLNKTFYKIPKFLRDAVAISLSSQVLTFPFLVLYFKEFSLGFLLGNLLLLPLINIIVYLGNILALTIKFELIFNYISFISYYLTLAIDIVSEKLINITPSILHLNEVTVVSYIIILITVYFYRRGYKNIIYFSSIIFFYIFMFVYSPIPKIEYFKEGILSISYKGERSIFAVKKGVDLDKYKLITCSNKEYKNLKKIKINNNIKVEKIKNDILINYNNKRYFIKLSSGNYNKNYDIIDCKYSNYVKIVFINNKLVVIN